MSTTASSSTAQAQAAAPAEIESTLSRLSAYRNVRGVMILSRRSSPFTSNSTLDPSDGEVHGGGGIVQSTGSVFEGANGKKYAVAIENVVNGVCKAVSDCEDGDELKLMRLRTKRHELIITPDDRYLLVVLQDPGQ